MMSAPRQDDAPLQSGSNRLFANDVVRVGEAEVVMARQAVRYDGTSARLTPTEWQLLLFFLGNPDVVLSRSTLAAGAWGDGYEGRDSEVEVYVSRLRRSMKLASPGLARSGR